MDCIPLFKKAEMAGRSLSILDGDVINKILLKVADAALEN
jgi:hypothetical protein